MSRPEKSSQHSVFLRVFTIIFFTEICLKARSIKGDILDWSQCSVVCMQVLCVWKLLQEMPQKKTWTHTGTNEFSPGLYTWLKKAEALRNLFMLSEIRKSQQQNQKPLEGTDTLKSKPGVILFLFELNLFCNEGCELFYIFTEVKVPAN